MKIYSTPDFSPTASALGPLARRGSRTSTHRAVRVTQLADSCRLGTPLTVSCLSGILTKLAGSTCFALCALAAACPIPIELWNLRSASTCGTLPDRYGDPLSGKLAG